MVGNKKIFCIYGASGAGSTTLGMALCEKLDYCLIDTDNYFWKYPEQPDMRIKEMYESIIKSDKTGVAITGSFWNWNTDYKFLVDQIDVFVRVMLDQNIRIERLIRRETQRYGDRIKENGDMYEKHNEFIKWAKKYDDGDLTTRSLKSHLYYEEKFKIKPIVVDSKNSVQENLEIILMEN